MALLTPATPQLREALAGLALATEEPARPARPARVRALFPPLWVALLLLLLALTAVASLGPRPPSSRRQEAAILRGAGRYLEVTPPGLRLGLPGRFQALAALPDGSRAYVAVEGQLELLVLDTVRLQWLAPLQLTFAPTAVRVLADGATVVARDEGSGAAAFAVAGEHLPWTPTARCEKPLARVPSALVQPAASVRLPAYSEPLLSQP